MPFLSLSLFFELLMSTAFKLFFVFLFFCFFFLPHSKQKDNINVCANVLRARLFLYISIKRVFYGNITTFLFFSSVPTLSICSVRLDGPSTSARERRETKMRKERGERERKRVRFSPFLSYGKRRQEEEEEIQSKSGREGEMLSTVEL